MTRTLLLAGTALVALAAYVVTASALPTTAFGYTGGFFDGSLPIDADFVLLPSIATVDGNGLMTISLLSAAAVPGRRAWRCSAALSICQGTTPEPRAAAANSATMSAGPVIVRW